MNSEHRKIIENKRDYLIDKICFDKIEPYLRNYNIFTKIMWEDVNSVSSVLDLLPSRGPKAFKDMIEVLRCAGYNQEADALENQEVGLYYKMSSKPLGFCLIINNVEFDLIKTPGSEHPVKHLEDRIGSDVDAISLCNFFQSIDFDVTVERNLTAKEIEDCLAEFTEKDFSMVDSVVIIILSHGAQKENLDFVYGKDGKFVYKADILEYFDNKRCCTLQNKPKIFFFNACRGNAGDYGVPKTIPPESIDAADFSSYEPTLTDIFIFHSTLPKYVSIRDPEKGSYFCQVLISVLEEFHKKYDLGTIMKIVNNKLSQKFSKMFHIVQVVHSEDLGGRKNIMLCRRQ